MAAFGDELRLERERRGISLDRLSAETKVNPRYLSALEQGAFHELPGGVFRKGILRSYVGCLGLDEPEWVARFDQSLRDDAESRGDVSPSNEEAWLKFATNVKRNRGTARPSTGWRWLGVAGLLICLGCAFWALWIYDLEKVIGRPKNISSGHAKSGLSHTSDAP
jgi:cytoskeleton protein RodZ